MKPINKGIITKVVEMVCRGEMQVGAPGRKMFITCENIHCDDCALWDYGCTAIKCSEKAKEELMKILPEEFI